MPGLQGGVICKSLHVLRAKWSLISRCRGTTEPLAPFDLRILCGYHLHVEIHNRDSLNDGSNLAASCHNVAKSKASFITS